MANISQIKGVFVAKYVKPTAVARTVQRLSLTTQGLRPQNQPVRREIDRRCGRDRRQGDHAILINLRSAHARRMSGRRDSENTDRNAGIDIYA